MKTSELLDKALEVLPTLQPRNLAFEAIRTAYKQLAGGGSGAQKAWRTRVGPEVLRFAQSTTSLEGGPDGVRLAAMRDAALKEEVPK